MREPLFSQSPDGGLARRLRAAKIAGEGAALPMTWYAVVSSKTESAVELFETRFPAERFIARLRADEPELADLLRVELVELS